MGDMQQWTDDYLKSLDAGSVNSARSPVDIASQLIANGALSKPVPIAPVDNSGSPSFWGRLSDLLTRPFYAGQGAIDQGVSGLTSGDPLGLAKNFAQSGGNSVLNTNVPENIQNINTQNQATQTGIQQGISGEKQTMPSDWMAKLFPQAYSNNNTWVNPLDPESSKTVFTTPGSKTTGNVLKGATNIAGLFTMDPLMYVNPVGALGKVSNVIKGAAADTAKADEILQDAVKSGSTIPDPVIATVAKPPTAAVETPLVTKLVQPTVKSAADQWRITNGLLDPAQQVSKSIDETAHSAVAAGDRSIPPHINEVTPISVPAGPKVYNNFTAATDWQALTKQAAKGKNGFDSTRGTERIASVNAELIPAMKANETNQLAHGIVPAISSSKDSTVAYPIFPSDILKAADPLMADVPYHVSNSVRSAPTMLAPSSMLAGAARALDLTAVKIPEEQAVDSILEHMIAADNRTKKSLVNVQTQAQFARAMWAATQDLHAAAVANKAMIINKNVADTAHIFSTDSGWIENALTNPTASQADAIHAIKDIGAGVEQTAKTVGATDEATKIAATSVAQHASQLGVTTANVGAARTAVRAAHDLGSMGTAAKAKINTRTLTQHTATTEDALNTARQVLSPGEKAMLDDPLDIGLATHIGITANIMRGMKVFWSRVADEAVEGAAPARLEDYIRSGQAVTQNEGLKFNQLIQRVDSIPTAPSMEGWSAMRAGLTSNTEAGSAAQKAWTAVANQVFDVSRGQDASSSLLGAFWRNSNGDVHLLNDMLGSKGITQRFNLQEAEKEFATKEAAGTLAKGESVFSIMANQWKKWDIKDPAQFMRRAYFGMQNLITFRSVAMDYAARFGSKVYKPGMTRIVDTNTKSILGKYMPQDVWFTKEAADNFARNEQMLHIATNYRGMKGPLASFVNEFYDPLMAIWKSAMTILRPAHLLRNVQGDMMFGFMDGVKTVRPYRIAMHAMNSVGRFGGDLTKLQELNKGVEITGGTHAITAVFKGGKKVPYTTERLYQMASQDGLFLNFHAYEDILSPTGNGIFNKLHHALVENPYMKAMGLANETISNGGRLGHYISLLDRPEFTKNFATEQEARMAAAARVRRFHPDPAGLSPTERRIMRRVSPFYSWTRQALPMVMETMVTHPARIMALPKATYGILQASGVDPKSISDQFPASALYPQFVRDNITGPFNLPQVGSFGGPTTMDFGTPVEGVLGPSLLNNSAGPGRSALGMLSPLVQAPIDLLTSTRMATGGHIADKGEYLDSLLPYLNKVADISGYSPSGTLANVTTGNFAGFPDPQRSVQSGEKEHFINNSTVNFLLGISSQNVNKSSYQKLAMKGL